MKILVTGSTGFIGRHLIRRLSQDKNNELFAFARRTSPLNLIPSYLQVLYGDICDFSSCRKAISESKSDIVFHCAGFVGEDSHLLKKVNIEGTENVAKACWKEGVRKLVYLSSISVISANPRLPLTEDEPFCASNTYGESKIAAEKIVWGYAKRGLCVTVLRPCMVYGEDEPHMLGLILWLLKRRLYPIIGKGDWFWHLLYIENLVDAMLLAIKTENSGPYIIADERALFCRRIFEIMAEELGVPPPWHMSKKLAYLFAAMAEGIKKLGINVPFSRRTVDFVTKDRLYSIEKAKHILNYYPRWDVEKALRLSVQRYLKKAYA